MKIRIKLAGEEHIPGVVGFWKEFMNFHQAKDPFFTMRKESRQRIFKLLPGGHFSG